MNPFASVINLKTPFLYDPSVGDLLLDVRNNSPENNRSNGNVSDTIAFDVSVQLIFVNGPEGAPSALTGNRSGGGLVTCFSTGTSDCRSLGAVPEPSRALLLALGLAALAGIPIRRRRQHGNIAL